MKLSFQTLLFILLAGLVALVAGRYVYFKPSFVQGEKAPDFQAGLRDGQAFTLSSLRGNYVLLDFWGSWCSPCRLQNAGWRAVYGEFAEKTFTDAQGFRIVSVGVERDADAWQQAIENDGLSWNYHILDLSSNLRFFSGPIAKKYQVRQLPTAFLLGPQGAIIAVDPEPAEVAEILASKVKDNGRQ